MERNRVFISTHQRFLKAENLPQAVFNSLQVITGKGIGFIAHAAFIHRPDLVTDSQGFAAEAINFNDQWRIGGAR
jgi:hypothetical protein